MSTIENKLQVPPAAAVKPRQEAAPNAAAAGAPAISGDAFSPPAKRIETGGISDNWKNKIPRFLRQALFAVTHFPAVIFGGIKRKLFPPQAAPQDTQGAKARASAALADIHAQFGVPGRPGNFQERVRSADAPDQGFVEGIKTWAKNSSGATVWPFGQVLGAELDQAMLTGDYSKVDEQMKTLQTTYWDGEAYRPGQLGGARFWDDNAWLGLDLMQAYAQTGNKSYLDQAEKMVGWMKTGLRKDGGIYWRENEKRMSLNTCANGPTIQMFLRLYTATKKPEYLELAKNLDEAMNRELRDPKTGLYWDNLGDDGNLDKHIFSYNQGTPVGADVQWYRLTGDKKYLERATQTANAALDFYAQDDRLWKSSPAFNAIMFRNLLALDQVAPNPRIRQTLEQYANRLWTEGRDPKTGLFNRGGMGGYGGHGNTDVLDQGGVAQVFALLAIPPEKLKDVA